MLMFLYILALPTQAFDLEAVSMFLFDESVDSYLQSHGNLSSKQLLERGGRRSRETPDSELRPKTLSLITACTKT